LEKEAFVKLAWDLFQMSNPYTFVKKPKLAPNLNGRYCGTPFMLFPLLKNNLQIFMRQKNLPVIQRKLIDSSFIVAVRAVCVSLKLFCCATNILLLQSKIITIGQHKH
jgi:hypothetical protein